MRALSLWQPFATLLVRGPKNIETRSWPAPQGAIGERIAIHATKQAVDPSDLPYSHQQALAAILGDQWGVWPKGCVVGTARLDRCRRVVAFKTTRHMELDDGGLVRLDPYGDFNVGRWLWFFSAFEWWVFPDPVRGRQGLWTYEGPNPNPREIMQKGRNSP